MAVARARWPLAKTPSAFQGEFFLAAGDLSRRILALEHAHEDRDLTTRNPLI